MILSVSRRTDIPNYYYQFTLTRYGKDIEPNLLDKRRDLIDAFQELSEKIGKARVIWR